MKHKDIQPDRTMITEEDIYRLLALVKNEFAIVLDDNILKKLASEIFFYHSHRSLPSFQEMQGSEKFKIFFQSILNDLAKRQQQIHFAQNYLQNPPMLTAEELTSIQKQVNSMGFTMSSRRYLQKDTIQLEKFVKDTMESLCQPSDKLLTAKHLSNLTRISLERHSERYHEEMAKEKGPVHIIHFYEEPRPDAQDYQGKPRAAEFLYSYDSDDQNDDDVSFDKTSHGLGSGIYGIGALNPGLIDEQIQRKSCYQIVCIENPLRLNEKLINDVSESELWSELSKNMQRIGDLAKKYQQNNRHFNSKLNREDALARAIEENTELEAQALALSQFSGIQDLSPDTALSLIKLSLQAFFFESKKRIDSDNLVAMPINYLMDKLGFTGTVSKQNDRFNRGLIAIRSEVSHLDWIKVPVKNVIDPLLTVYSTKIKPGAGGKLASVDESSKDSPATILSTLLSNSPMPHSAKSTKPKASESRSSDLERKRQREESVEHRKRQKEEEESVSDVSDEGEDEDAKQGLSKL